MRCLPGRSFVAVALASVALFVLPGPAALRAQESGGVVSPVAGGVEYRAGPDGAFATLTESRHLPPPAEVRTADDGYALIRYADSTEVVVRPGATVRVGGEGTAGVRVLLGRVLIRVKKLFRSGQERRHSTPTTVAAVRGTEFGLAVERSGRTGVFVFDGRVEVRNPSRPDAAVEVDAGEMTTVDVGRVPTSPRPFDPSEFNAIGVDAAVERGEDRVVEGSQAPVALRFLAFPDPDIDALRNPAYLADGRGRRLVSVGLVQAFSGTSTVESGGVETRVQDDRGTSLVTQHIGVAQVGGVRIAATGTGEWGSDRGVVGVRLPGEVQTRFQRDRVEWSVGEGRLLAALVRPGFTAGAAASYRSARRDQRIQPLEGDPVVTTGSENSDVVSVSGGVKLPAGAATLGLAYHHDDISVDSDLGPRAGALSSTSDAGEALIRWGHGGVRWAGWARVEHTTGVERVRLDGAAAYDEDWSITTGRVGVGLGLQPREGVIVSADVGLGLAHESAEQVAPSGTVIEDERDTRLSASAHLASQVRLQGPWYLDLTVLHSLERVDRAFDLPPQGAAAGFSDLRTAYGTLARMGLLYRGGRLVAGYGIETPAAGGRPFIHSMFGVLRVP